MNTTAPHAPRYPRPQQPDMLADGSAQRLTFRKHRYVGIERNTEPVVRKRRSILGSILSFLFGQGIILTVIVVLLISCLVVWNVIVYPWWTTTIVDQWQYGAGKITQVDNNVGHQGESHFVAEWYNHQIIVIEISVANPGNAHIYTIGGFLGQDSEVVQLSFVDENGDGKLDMVISLQGSTYEKILYNNGSTFQQTLPGSN
jgi:hypothetical protein